MELLSFMYSGKLTTTQPTLVLDIMMAADKFEVLSCMRHCSQLLRSLPMTTESALLYLDHPCSISMAAEVQHVTDAAKEYLANKFKDLATFPVGLMNMPLAGIEAIFSSTGLHVESEDSIYSFLLDWAREQYPESEERHKIWGSRLLPLVRFSHMTWGKLQQVLASTNNDVDHEQTTKRIADMLLHKAFPAHKQDLAEDAATCWQVPERAYTYKPLKVVEFDQPCQQVTVFLDLTREEWLNFYLAPNCEWDEKRESYHFGLRFALDRDPEYPLSLTLDCEVAARKRSSVEFVSIVKDEVIFTGGMQGCSDILGIPWPTFIADDDIFINGVLHLRANFRVVAGQPGLQA
uniref:Uncharacterized protein n=1 Tax=Avena sativa TaxID=4498 RepID=A0ACD6A2V9_AVESA